MKYRYRRGSRYRYAIRRWKQTGHAYRWEYIPDVGTAVGTQADSSIER